MIHENDQDIETYMQIMSEDDKGLKRMELLQLHEQMKSGTDKPSFYATHEKDSCIPYVKGALKNIRKQSKTGSLCRYLFLYSSAQTPATVRTGGVVDATKWNRLQEGATTSLKEADLLSETRLIFVQLRSQLKKTHLTIQEFEQLLRSFRFNHCVDESFQVVSDQIESLIREHPDLGMRSASMQAVRNATAGLFLHVFRITLTRKQQERRFTTASLVEVISRHSNSDYDCLKSMIDDLKLANIRPDDETEEERQKLLADFQKKALERCQELVKGDFELKQDTMDLLQSICGHFKRGNFTLRMILIVDKHWDEVYGLPAMTK